MMITSHEGYTSNLLDVDNLAPIVGFLGWGAKGKLDLGKQPALDQYRDVYTQKLTRLIEAKVAGEEIVTPPQTEQTQIINLMDALRQSVATSFFV
jgi:phage-related protein